LNRKRKEVKMAESVNMKYGHFVVEPWRVEKIMTQELNEDEVERIIETRWQFLDWMCEHFVHKCLVCPEKYKGTLE